MSIPDGVFPVPDAADAAGADDDDRVDGGVGGPRARGRTSRSAIVVGAGISGLAAARGLVRAGWRVAVYEKAPKFGAAGSGIALEPNAIRVLDWLGLGPALRARGVRQGGVGQRGRILLDAPDPPRSGGNLGRGQNPGRGHAMIVSSGSAVRAGRQRIRPALRVIKRAFVVTPAAGGRPGKGRHPGDVAS
jgi:hypothetical protein